MPRPQREKDFPIFSSPGSSTKKKTASKELSQAEANASVSELTSQTTMEQILSDVKLLSSRMKDMDASIGTRLDIINVALGDFKVSADLEKRMEEAEGRISGTEDSLGTHGTSIAALEKLDDLENRGRRKNLKIINLPEKVEGDTPLVDFLQNMLPTLVGLPADHPPLEIEQAHRALAPAPAPNKPPRSILVRFLRYPHREAVLNAAKKKRDIHYGGSQLRFYPDLSAEVLRRRQDITDFLGLLI
uniref:L1 transposable element RRM domain-containing protein n=1 Tax=Cyprinodon variegatus TaxID=28743 RepID=A0A3Q2DLE7_CYPVA